MLNSRAQSDAFHGRGDLRPEPRPLSTTEGDLARLISHRFSSDTLSDNPEQVHALLNLRAPWLHPYRAIAMTHELCIQPIARTPLEIAIALKVTRWEWLACRLRSLPEPFGPDLPPDAPNTPVSKRRSPPRVMP